jgi:response regulator RpfG family c-di-GMP phosphodiesterase
LATQFRPELIFLDLQLPDTDGFSLLKEIRTGWPDDLPQPGFVILSGESSFDKREALNLSAEIAIITKPASCRDIQDLANRHLSHFHLIQQNTEKDSDPVPSPVLRRVFLRDLETQCPLLDKHIAGLDWPGARGVLHQMIAASAMCRETHIERYCRLLNSELADSCQPEPLSQAFFGLLRAIDQSRHEFRPGGSPRAFP